MKEYLKRFSLLTNYDVKKTLSENIDDVDDELEEELDDDELDGEMEEQDAGSGSSSGGKPPPYPNVTKWTSGRKFGPTYNPDQKVWTTGLTRGKANTLL